MPACPCLGGLDSAASHSKAADEIPAGLDPSVEGHQMKSRKVPQRADIPAELDNHRSARKVRHDHAGLEYHIRTRLGREFPFMDWIVISAEFGLESGFIIRRKQDHGGLSHLKAGAQDFDHRRGWIPGRLHQFTPLERLKTELAQEMKHRRADTHVSSVNYKDPLHRSRCRVIRRRLRLHIRILEKPAAEDLCGDSGTLRLRVVDQSV